MPLSATTVSPIGALAARITGQRLPVQVLHSAAGYYLGTTDGNGPVSRESAGYFLTRTAAQQALDTGDWTPRVAP